MFSFALRRKFKVKTTFIYFLVISCKIIRCVCHISGNSFTSNPTIIYIIFAGFNRALFCETEFLTPGLGDTPSLHVNVILTHFFLCTK